MKKILFLNLYDYAATGGGAEVTLHHLTQGLRQRGLEPVILSTCAEPGLHQIEREGVRIWRAGLRNLYWPSVTAPSHPMLRTLWHAMDSYNFAMQPILRRVLEVERPDVVSIHNLPGWSGAAWGTVADAGIPSVQVLHDSYAICAKTTMYATKGNCPGQCARCRLFRLPHRRQSKRVSAVVGVSRFILDRHLIHGYFREVPIQKVIHNARDGAQLGLNAEVSRNTNGRLRFGFIGRLDQTKGVEYLLQAFENAALPNADLWVAGTGMDDYVQRLRTRYNSERIHFLGHVAPREFYPQVDVVVVPSLWHDTFPGVVFEAFAFGKPVIGARRGGIPEMIRDGANGLLVEPDRPNELVTALQRLASDELLRECMGQAAKASGQPFLNQEKWVSQYVDLYAEIGGGRL